MICTRCHTPIVPGQLYLPYALYCKHTDWGVATYMGPAHVACPTEHEIAHRKRMGRL